MLSPSAAILCVVKLTTANENFRDTIRLLVGEMEKKSKSNITAFMHDRDTVYCNVLIFKTLTSAYKGHL